MAKDNNIEHVGFPKKDDGTYIDTLEKNLQMLVQIDLPQKTGG